MISFVKGENLSKLSKEVVKKICGDEPLTRLWRNFGLFLTLPELDWKILIG